MTDLRKAAMQEALEFLDEITLAKGWPQNKYEHAVAAAKLRAALAAPESAPPLDALRALPPEPSEEAVQAGKRAYNAKSAEIAPSGPSWEPMLAFARAAYRVDAIDSRPAAPDGWRPIESAPKDGTLLLLMVEFEEHSFEDGNDFCQTIGMNNFENDGEDLWQFAGWDWSHDCFTNGAGQPTHWRPLLDAPTPKGETP